ncbi:MAG: galactokinase family protein [Sphaerochaetaceae bacterium]|nr:galactokinase family protein [Sphaerochaetaceae bacterium]MDX9808571.1 galactokinase family protein [Sphaerochaetaceae bacterium]
MKDINELHQSEFEIKPQVIVVVPGIHTLLGEFSDYCKGFSLCGASPHTLEVAASLRNDQNARLISSQQNDRKRFNIQNLKYRREDRWANYAKGVMATFSKRGYTVSGINISITGSLLKHEGNILSSAICMGCAMAMNHLFDIHLPLDEIAAIAYLSYSSFCGEHGRFITFLAMANAREASLMLFNVQHLTWEYIPFPPLSSPIVSLIVESKISPYALREELSIKHRESKLVFEKLRILFPTGLLRDIPDQEIKDSSVPLSEDEKRSCMYVLSESRLAREGARLLAQNDMVMYGKVLNKVQTGLRDAFEVTCPEVDWLTKRAVELQGCLGAAMITTGSSGTVMVLLPQDLIAAYTQRMEEYEHIFGFRPKWSVYQPKGAARIVSEE